jgi:hypothetical protein
MNEERAKNWPLEDKMRIYRRRDNRYEKEKKEYDTKKVLKVLKECGYLKPIHHGDYLTYASTIYQEDIAELESLENNPLLCTRLKINKKEFKPNYKFVFYADCETSTGKIHAEYNICFVRSDGKCRCQIFGEDCVRKFLDRMPNRSLVYFHNLSYTINFIINKLDRVDRPIIKQGRTLSIKTFYKGKKIVFKESYSIIASKLKDFPTMFKVESGEKEVFPYQYYSSELLED